jgi:hypothetical protein
MQCQAIVPKWELAMRTCLDKKKSRIKNQILSEDIIGSGTQRHMHTTCSFTMRHPFDNRSTGSACRLCCLHASGYTTNVIVDFSTVVQYLLDAAFSVAPTLPVVSIEQVTSCHENAAFVFLALRGRYLL